MQLIKCHKITSTISHQLRHQRSYPRISYNWKISRHNNFKRHELKGKQDHSFWRRNLQIQFLKLKSMVISNLEYCASVWSSHTEKLKSKLKQVQRRAARYVTNRYHNISSVSATLNHLQWPTLEHRRNLKRITILYFIKSLTILLQWIQNFTLLLNLLSVQETITHHNIKLYPPEQTIINTFFPTCSSTLELTTLYSC